MPWSSFLDGDVYKDSYFIRKVYDDYHKSETYRDTVIEVLFWADDKAIVVWNMLLDNRGVVANDNCEVPPSFSK